MCSLSGRATVDVNVSLTTIYRASVAERPVGLPPLRQELVMHSANIFLRSLPVADLALFEADLRVVELPQGQVLAQPHQLMEKLYFPHSGIVSYVVEMSDGNMIETGMVGRDGVVGALQAIDDKVSPNKIAVQVPGKASVVDMDRLRKAIDGC